MQNDLEKFEPFRLQIVGVSFDPVATLSAFAQSANISFPLLSDEGSQTIEAFDLLFENGLPHPGTVIIDRTGTIRGKIFRDGYRDRHDTEALVELARQLELK